MNASWPSTPVSMPATPERILLRLDWQVVRPLDGLLQGNYHTLFYGPGLDFADLREYQAEDDIRHIDWNVTARLNHPYVRQFYEEREITGWFLLDLSPSMAFGPQGRQKRQVLLDLVATLARLLTRNGNRVGAMLYNRSIERTIPPLGGQRQVLRLIRELEREDGAQSASETDLKVLLQAGYNTIKRRSLLFLISDFFSRPGWEKPLALLNRRHDLVAIRLWDRREDELPNAGLITIRDSETGEQLDVDTADPAFRRRLSEAVQRREARLAESLSRAGVDLFAVSTEDDLVRALVGMASLRKHRKRSWTSCGPTIGPHR
jgi:uncharacterized protein (DUF58 family)